MTKPLHLFIVSILIGSLLAGCAASKPQPDSGVEGQVFIGPMCPVVQIGNPCPDQPYQATLTILDTNARRVARFQTAADGTFSFALAPGKYTLRPESPGTMPHATEQDFTVLEGEYTHLVITYDSGIR